VRGFLALPTAATIFIFTTKGATMLRLRLCVAVVLAGALACSALAAEKLTDSLTKGTPELKCAGPICFGPEGILFFGDYQGAIIYAIDTQDTTRASSDPIKIEKLDEKIAGMIGTDTKGFKIKSMAVNPASGNVYLSVSRGEDPKATAVLLKVTRGGEVKDVPLNDVKFSKATLSNAVDGKRQEAITQIGYVDGKVIVAGLSNEEFASKLRSIPFPFKDADKGTSVEIYHGSHGALETKSPVRTFTFYDIDGETNVLAAYTCTPLVKFPLSQLKAGEKVKGTTIAELGNQNVPLDMFVYQKDGKDFILMANNKRGVMKITTENIAKVDAITKKVSNTAGLAYETIKDLQNVQRMAKLDKDHAIVLTRTEGGNLNLETIALP
jgi:hypothetical protein